MTLPNRLRLSSFLQLLSGILPQVPADDTLLSSRAPHKLPGSCPPAKSTDPGLRQEKGRGKREESICFLPSSSNFLPRWRRPAPAVFPGSTHPRRQTDATAATSPVLVEQIVRPVDQSAEGLLSGQAVALLPASSRKRLSKPALDLLQRHRSSLLRQRPSSIARGMPSRR